MIRYESGVAVLTDKQLKPKTLGCNYSVVQDNDDGDDGSTTSSCCNRRHIDHFHHSSTISQLHRRTT